jgi:hypothetical protein
LPKRFFCEVGIALSSRHSFVYQRVDGAQTMMRSRVRREGFLNSTKELVYVRAEIEHANADLNTLRGLRGLLVAHYLVVPWVV